jgi:type I restriction enzyme, S subunit
VSTRWPLRKIKEIADHSLGKMLDKSKNKGELKPYLRNQNVRWFEFDLSDVAQMRFLPEEEEKYTALRGDVLICEGGYPGRAAIWDRDEPIHFQKALHRVRFHERERNRWFLYYLLSKDLDGTLRSHFNGAGIQHFTGEALAQFELPVPPLDEQRRIVGVLDEASRGIATAKSNAEQNARNARAVFESRLRSVFLACGPGWVETTIGESCTLKSGTTVSPALESPSGDVPYVKVADMTFGGNEDQITTSSRYLRIADVRTSAIIPAGATIFPKRGGAILTNKKRITARPICADLNIMAVIPSSKIDAALLYLYFLDVDMRELGTGSSIPQINNYDIAPLRISFPQSLAKQAEIVRNLNELREQTQRLCVMYERKIAAMEALTKSLLHRAFTGQL